MERRAQRDECERTRGCKLEGEFSVMKTEMASMSNELSTLRSKTLKPEVDPLLLQKCRTLEKERDELRASLKAAEEQLDALRREVVALTFKKHHRWTLTGTC